MRIPDYSSAGWVLKKKGSGRKGTKGLQRRVQNLAVGDGSRQEEPSRRSYHRFACGAVLGSPLLLPLAIPRCAPSPSPAAALDSSIRFGGAEEEDVAGTASGPDRLRLRREGAGVLLWARPVRRPPNQSGLILFTFNSIQPDQRTGEFSSYSNFLLLLQPKEIESNYCSWGVLGPSVDSSKSNSEFTYDLRPYVTVYS
jgi:hypothetical protein